MDGPTEYEKKRAEMLAQLGYAAFCADIYGKGSSQGYFGSRPLAVNTKATAPSVLRVNAGLTRSRKSELVDSKRIAAIGYCFGGTTVIELARSGADLAA